MHFVTPRTEAPECAISRSYRAAIYSMYLFTAIGDAPERLFVSTIDMTKEWSEWRVSPPVDVMQPETDYECGRLPVAPSAVGDIFEPARQIRDPHVLEDGGKRICSTQSAESRESPAQN